MPGSLFFKIKVPVTTQGVEVEDVEVEEGEMRQPDLLLDGKSESDDHSNSHAHSSSAGNQSPPWRQPRTVVEASVVETSVIETGDGTSESAPGERQKRGCEHCGRSYYSALKQRLVHVPTSSSHSRQSLYRDKYTGQFWLGLRASMGSSWTQPVEVLKPLGLEVAKSLTCKSSHAVKMLSSATMANSALTATSLSGRLLH